ncbi:hypothetical protein VNO78_11469 [Psophocarpus tetragonolobus]|uniref:EKN n=1 Tax=Psophocarpus tetragonolobus TaxID=3891 RepID=A0AAN9SPB0_PSOTE
MGNCGSNPKTNEGPEVAVPEPVSEVEQKERETTVETNTDETTDKSLGTLLNEKVEEAPTKEEEPKTEELNIQEEKPKPEETKTQA